MMMSYVWLVVLLCATCHVSRGQDDDNSGESGEGGDKLHGGRRERGLIEGFYGEKSHFCVGYTNVQITKVTYPDCVPDINKCTLTCTVASGGWWRSRRSRRTCTRHACCNNMVTLVTIEARADNYTCCDGYAQRGCTQPICRNKCTDTTQTCIAPDTCGPACYPACRHGGTCTANPSTCACTTGWTGATCNTHVQCSTTDLCLNGGTCSYGRCRCTSGFVGYRCEKAVCDPRCMNDGVCTASRTCQCVNGYTGATCATPPSTGGNP